MKTQSHYDNLKVSRDAPLEVIRAAYRTLAQKHHPDRNSNAPEAARIMGLINKAYEVLSDPKRRHEHDAWLHSVENKTSTQQTYSFTYDISKGASAKAKASERERESKKQEPVSNATLGGLRFKVAKHVRTHWLYYVFASTFAVLAISNVFTPTSPRASSPVGVERVEKADAWAGDKVIVSPTDAKSSRVASNRSKSYVRPENAPNGYPWPVRSDYVKGYRVLNSEGRSSVTIDNTRNTSDVFVRLATLDVAEHPPVRQVFILAGQSFTLAEVRAGDYEIRYRDLDSGAMSRSEPIHLNETTVGNRTNFSKVSITLYKVRDGNMKTTPIDEDTF